MRLYALRPFEGLPMNAVIKSSPLTLNNSVNFPIESSASSGSTRKSLRESV